MPVTANPGATILLVADDLPRAEVLRAQLTARGYAICHAESAAEAEAVVDVVVPDLVIIDLIRTDTHSLVLCSNLRDRITAPIIICAESQRPDVLLLGFKLGADDVVARPFSAEELAARIEAALRRPARNPALSISDELMRVIGPLAIDQARCRVTLNGHPIHLTPTEYRLLCILAERPNHVLSSHELAERVWGAPDADVRRALESHFRRLRAKLNPDPIIAPVLRTVRGFGYELVWEPGEG
jgi:DNA-binding response OmpR family regulator